MLLIVEKNTKFVDKFKNHLNIDGLRNFFVESCQDALFLVQSMKTRFMLVNLNGVDDWQALIDLEQKAEEQDIPILYIEGAKENPPYQTWRKAANGSRVFIQLPFGVKDLTQKIIGMRQDIDPMLGVRLGPAGHEVEIRQRLGAGTMGSVYLAHQESLDRQVAVKLLSSDYADSDPESFQRFKNEARAIAQLRGEHVVQVYFVGVYQNRPYMVMEFIDGPNLDKYLRKKKVLSPNEALHLIRMVLLGLETAHLSGMVHRDMKPANIMLNKQGKAVILDFGLVREQRSQKMTLAGAVLGTPRYISPEQVSGGHVDQRSDLYAVGIILYEMLMGTPPFKGEEFMVVLMKHLKEPLPPPETFGKSLPPTLWRFLDKLTRKQPGERFESARAAITALDALTREGPLEDTIHPGLAETVITQNIKPKGGLAVNESGSTICRFGQVPGDRAQSLHILNTLLSQIQDIEEVGAFERGLLTLENTKMAIFSYFDGLAGVESDLEADTSKLNRMTHQELATLFERELHA